MKKIFTLLTLLTIGVIYAQATDYGLTIAGKQITSTGNIDAGQTSGTISWDGSTLTFSKVNINHKGSRYTLIYYSGTEDLTIRFMGNNTIKSDVTILNSVSSNAVSMQGERNATGRLTMELNDDADPREDVVRVNGNLKIRFLYLTVNGKYYAIVGNGSNKIDFGETVLLAKAPLGSGGAVRDFASATFNAYDAYLTTGHFDTQKKAVCDDNGNPLKEVKTDAGLFVGNAIVGYGYISVMGVYPNGQNSGSITFDYKNYTLTLDGIDIKCADRFIDNKKLNNLKILVKGTNTVDVGNNWGIFSLKNFSVEGGSSSYSADKLTIKNSFGPLCLWLSSDAENSTMTLRNLTLDVAGTNVGIYCATTGNLEGTLKIDNCKIESKVTASTDRAGIHGFKTCTLDGCGVDTRETPARYDTAKKGFTNIEGTFAPRVVIDIPTTIYDGVKVLGTTVTNLNADDILVEGQTEGRIRYYEYSKMLGLIGVRLTAPEGNTSSGLSVSSNAVSTIYVGDGVEIRTEGNVIQTFGSGTITLEGNFPFAGISSKESGLTMDGSGGFVFNFNGPVRLEGKKRGIWGNGTTYSSSIVTMREYSFSDYSFKGIESGAIINVADLKLEGMDFYYNNNNYISGTPGCYFSDKNVRSIGGDIVRGDNRVNFYKISETYGITVAGTPVTNCNRLGVGSKYITGGSPVAVTYTPETNQLQLHNATIEYNGDDKNFVAFRNDGVDGLDIRLDGNNVINTSGYVALQLDGGSSGNPVTTKITGDGKLDAKSSWFAVRICSYNTLDIGESVQVKAEAPSSGIADNGLGNTGQTLIIRDNARVEAKGSPSIQRLNTIQLEDGIKILKPAGAEIKQDDTYGWGVYVGDNLTSEWVVFGETMKGDVNNDTKVDVADIATVLSVMAGTEKDTMKVKLADVNDDDKVDVADVSTILSIMSAASRQETDGLRGLQ